MIADQEPTANAEWIAQTRRAQANASKVSSPQELRAWRRTRFLSQGALASLLGVHLNTLNRWERGEAAITGYLHLALERLDQLYVWEWDGHTPIHGPDKEDHA